MVPFDLDLPSRWKRAKWKVKIRDKERAEEPHVTILRGPDVWRVSLRTGTFLDGGAWSDIPDGVRQAIEAHMPDLKAEWDRRCPWNLVGGNTDD